MEEVTIEKAQQVKDILVGDNVRKLDDLMYEAIKLIPYLNSHKKLHRIYKPSMIQVIEAALLASNTKLIELNAYTSLENKNSIILNEVEKEKPVEN